MLNLVRNFRYRCYCTQVLGKYVQGQSPKEGVREYFYYIDHQGQLFLEGTKIRNFVTCFKDTDFLQFFFKRLKINKTGKYVEDFPYVSRCGPEMNYVRCENRPVVYTDVLDDEHGVPHIVANGIGKKLMFPFEAQKLCMLPLNGRVYHPAPARVGGAGILKTSLAIEFSSYFLFEGKERSDDDPPSHFRWNGLTYKLQNELWEVLKAENVEENDKEIDS